MCELSVHVQLAKLNCIQFAMKNQGGGRAHSGGAKNNYQTKMVCFKFEMLSLNFDFNGTQKPNFNKSGKGAQRKKTKTEENENENEKWKGKLKCWTYRNKICRNPNGPIAPCRVPRDLHTTMGHVQVWWVNTFQVYKMLMLNHRWPFVVYQHPPSIFAWVLSQQQRWELHLATHEMK